MKREFSPRNPDYAVEVRDSFLLQPAMALIGAVLTEITPGYCRIELPTRSDLTQQHGFIHGGIVGMIADSAAGYAAFSLFPSGSSVLTVEYKLNLLEPAAGERLIAEGRVVKSGRTLTICDMEVFSTSGDARRLVARGVETLICLEGRGDNEAGFKKR